jgi:hypothetical protein
MQLGKIGRSVYFERVIKIGHAFGRVIFPFFSLIAIHLQLSRPQLFGH